mgnify:CR=1 FL=1
MKQLKGFMHGINLGGWLSQCSEYTQAHYNSFIKEDDINDTLSWYQDISKVFDKYGIGRAAWTYKAMDFGLMEEHYASRRNEIIKCL